MKKTILILFFSRFLSLALGEDCLLCHDDPDLTLERDGREISLAVTPMDLGGTPHEGFDCLDCHAGLDENEIPHADPIPSALASCLDCHDDIAEQHGFHPAFLDLDVQTVQLPELACSGCHNTHRIISRGEPNYPFTPTRQTSRCGTCHELESIGYLHSAHARALEEGADNAPTCIGCHSSREVVAAHVDGNGQRKVLLSELCMSCHVEDPEVVGKTLYGTPFMTSFESSVHGKALFGGNPDAPSCADCHGSHEVARAADQRSHVSRGQVVKSCSQCHEEAAEEYLHSVHAVAFSKGNLDSPVCTNCHGEHNILAHTDPNSPVAPANLAVQVCGDCHGSVKLTERYGMDPDKLKTFEDSFHGLATRGGAVAAVNCASCHGYHDVRDGADPESLVHPDNLAKTCGHCHEGANERFAKGKVHVRIDRASEEPVLYWIATIYIWGILVIVGGMFLHNLLDFIRKTRDKARAHWHHHILPAEQAAPHRLYERMTLHERLQHGILALSFIILVITGFMLRYPEAWWVEGLRDLSGHIFEWRSLTHRVAGIVMCLAGLWHFWYITSTRRGRELVRDLLPRRKDLTDTFGVVRYNLGLSDSKPPFGRFSYIEKAEYWALIWGSILMTVTGFLLWYENLTIGLLTKLGFDISRTVHFYEAVLATLAIVVWHLYFVIFNPDVYPMNLSWLTGKMSEEEMETEHPLELKRIRKEEGDRDNDAC